VRAVNHRHLQVKSRLPGELFGLEAEVEARIKKRLSRGAVSVSVSVARRPRARPASTSRPRCATATPCPSSRSASARGGVAARGGASGLPGVLATAPDELGEQESAAVLRLLERALGELERMRAAEGAAIEADLKRNADAIAKLVARVEKRMPRVVRAHHEALRKRVAELMAPPPPPTPRTWRARSRCSPTAWTCRRRSRA
jgi:uncharacterized protein (TIGR00255 family)